MKIVRKKLDGGTTFPKYVRYNETTEEIEVSYDNGETWEENPALDPRTSTALIQAKQSKDTQCETAANVRAFLQTNIDGVLDIFEDFGTAVGAVGAIVTLLIAAFLTLGPFGVIVAVFFGLAGYLVSLGSVAIQAAFITDEWDLVLCNIYENTPVDGIYTQPMLDAIIAANAADLNTTAAGIVNGMLLLMGFVGVTNAGKTGTNSADCDCAPACQLVNNFTVAKCDFVLTASQGAWISGIGWECTSNGTNQQLFIERICEDEVPTSSVFIKFIAYRYNNYQIRCYDAVGNLTANYNQNRNAGTHSGSIVTTGSRKVKKIVIYSGVSGTSAAGAWQEVNLEP